MTPIAAFFRVADSAADILVVMHLYRVFKGSVSDKGQSGNPADFIPSSDLVVVYRWSCTMRKEESLLRQVNGTTFPITQLANVAILNAQI